ncbi:hypothetical protein [Shewanella algae]|uniref:hypothetical protein n=1 Tax=Shewanella algae TaxID=38313 RepID=UPI001184E2F8|nr:hypothetical protein [Shewanella algae]TVP04742.1 hypothetical protein AYI73_15790 [Shewanella algae]
MIEYITVADVDEKLGDGWADAGKKSRAVMIANVWLTNRNLPLKDADGKSYPDEVQYPDEWIQAGAEIAMEAANGNIYGTREEGVLSKTVKADTVSSSKTFSATYRQYSNGESLALALLAPWLPGVGGGMSQFKLSRG